jgi:hypothetical protein
VNPRNKLRATIRGFTLFLDDFTRRTPRYCLGLLRYRAHWLKFSDALVHSADAAGSHLAVEAELHQLLRAQAGFLHLLIKAENLADDASPAPVLSRERTPSKKRDGSAFELG